MTGRERMQRINNYYAGVARTRTQLFTSGALNVLPCWGDEVDAMIATQLESVHGPVQLGLWVWDDAGT